MSVLFFTNINRYLKTHEAFKLDLLRTWQVEYGFNFFVRVLDDVDIDFNQYPGFYFTNRSPNREELKTHIDNAISIFKPTKVVNFLEKFFPFELVECDAKRIYFVRSCAAKLLEVLRKYNDGSDIAKNVIAHYESLSKHEGSLLKSSDMHITTSPNSVKSVYEKYGIDCELCLEFINPTKYNNIPAGGDISTVFNIGRRDFQKGLHLIKAPKLTKFISVGKKEVGKDECVADNILSYDVMDFVEYSKLIKDCVYGIYPSIWESNGYAVQECLAMGKIPVVQQGSGGNERNLTKDNSFVIDFNMGRTDWEDIIYSNNIKSMQENARDTITYKIHRDSFLRFIEIITK